MRLFKKNDTQKNNTKLPMTGRVKKGFRFYCMVVMAMTVVLGRSVTAFAAGDVAGAIERFVPVGFRRILRIPDRFRDREDRIADRRNVDIAQVADGRGLAWIWMHGQYVHDQNR